MELSGCLRFFVGGEIIESYCFRFVSGFCAVRGSGERRIDCGGGVVGSLVPDYVVQLLLYSAISYLNRQFLHF